MDVDDLRLLDAVAAEGSFSRAAARLRLSQPSVSARIAAVERAVGAPLFARDPRGARLTPAGQRYLHYVRRCLQLLEQGRHAAAQRAGQAIRVGVPASYAPAIAPLLADAVGGLQLTLSIRAGHSAQLREQLRDGLLDMAFATPGAVPPGITSRLAAESPVVALAVPLDAAPPGTAALPDAGGRRFAVHSWSQEADDVISEMLAADEPGRQVTVVSPAAAAIALALHRGYVAIVPRITAVAELRAGWLRPVPLPLPRFTARLDCLYPARHPERERLETIGRVIRQAARRDPA
jgi:DNA-binding transcriptional LysR family regulator